ncbi:MAG: ABC transporter ATP-binding protein [Clostridiaceae bacterium]
MKLKEVMKHLSNAGWVAASIRPFLKAVVIIIIVESLTSLGSVLMAIVSKNVIDFAVKNELNRAGLYIALFAGIILFNLAARAFLSIYSAKTHESYSNTLRQRIFGRLVNIEWMQVSKYHSGDLLTRLTSDIGAVASGSINILAQVTALGVQLVAAFVILLAFEPSLALMAFFLAPFTVLISRFYAKKMSNMHIRMQESESLYRSQIQEYLQNLLVLKTYNLEEQSKDRIGELQKERLDWVIKRSKTGATANSILSLGYWLGYILAFCWGAVKLANETATFGTFTQLLQLVNQIQGPFIALSRTVPLVISGLASAGRLIELEKLDAETPEAKIGIPASAGICFNEVSFKYEKDEQVLDTVTMEAQPGEIIAIIGTSGEGKTTMIRLMLALLKPDAGMIACFDGSGNEYEISCATRNWFSYVPQGNTLFSGTIADNLRSGEQEADEDEMKAALNAVCALDFVEKLPVGINTVIGEKAYGLSEGQAQRIAIARALLRKAPIIVLDEATSALDIELEEKVLHNIRNMKPVRTCIMITHRRTALNECNKVYKLKDGILILEDHNLNCA